MLSILERTDSIAADSAAGTEVGGDGCPRLVSADRAVFRPQNDNKPPDFPPLFSVLTGVDNSLSLSTDLQPTGKSS